MYLLYVDECGDTGLVGSIVDHYILSGLIIHESSWNAAFDEIKDYRRNLRSRFMIRVRDELKARHFIHRKGPWYGKKSTLPDRLQVYRDLLQLMVGIGCFEIVNIVVRKPEAHTQNPTWTGYNVEDTAWSFLLTRFHNYLTKKSPADNGLLIPDEGHGNLARDILRMRRRFNPVPSRYDPARTRPQPLMRIVEDPFFKDSADSLFIQLADLVAYSLWRKEVPDLKHGFDGSFFDLLDPILLKAATRKNAQGIVYYPDK
jgi:hypothetical protein